MTRDEAKSLIMEMTVAYPNFHPADISLTIDVWATMLEEYSFFTAKMALKKYVLTDTSGFAPGIGQLLEQMQNVSEGDDMDELQAWSLVGRALRNSANYPEQEFEKLPPVVQRAVGSPANLEEWAKMDSEVVNSVIQSNVIKNYRTAARRMREEKRLPESFRNLLAAQHTEQERLIQENREPPMGYEGCSVGEMNCVPHTESRKESQPDNEKRADPELVKKLLENLRQSLGTGNKHEKED